MLASSVCLGVCSSDALVGCSSCEDTLRQVFRMYELPPLRVLRSNEKPMESAKRLKTSVLTDILQ